MKTALRIGAMTGLAIVVALRFRDAVFNYFFLDDFWVMHAAAKIHLSSPADLLQFFRVSHVGFLMYRPLTTVAYLWVLRQLFGYDTSAYHAFQVFVFMLSTLLAFAIVRRLSQSVAAALAVGILFVLAPGQMVAVNWLAAFTVSGTALALLVLLWCWVALGGAWRAGACAVVQTVALFCSEHAVTGPFLLAVVAILSPRHEPWRGAARALAPSALIVAAYLAAKAIYFMTSEKIIILPQYSVTFDPRLWLTALGQYAAFSFNGLALLAPGAGASFAIGLAMAAVGLFAAWRSLRGGDAWRLLATGLGLYAGALLAVAVLPGTRFPQYVALAAFGWAIALVGLLPPLGRHWRGLALTLALGVLALDGWTEGRAWRRDPIYRMVSNANGPLLWLQALQLAAQRIPPPRTIFIPSDPLTANIFGQNRFFHTLVPSLPQDVRLYGPGHPPPAPDGTLVLAQSPRRLDPTLPIPGCEPRWDWLRRLAAAGEDPATLWAK